MSKAKAPGTLAEVRSKNIHRGWKGAVSILALLVLGVVITRLDLVHLGRLIAQAHWGVVLAVLPMGLLVVTAGALRYRALALQAGLQMPSLTKSIAEYWRSLALGLVVPGSVGSDVYRVVAASRRTGRALPAAKAVMTEKVVALLACAAVAMAALPLAAPAGLRLWGNDLRWVLFSLCGALLLVSWIAPGLGRWLQQASVLQRPRAAVLVLTERLALQAGAGLESSLLSQPEARPPRSRLAWLEALGWSVMALSLSALQAQAFFLALDVTVPLAVNFLVAPLLFITLALPLSVGGLGVRELAYITWYAACGVPAEGALVVSTFSLGSQLLSHGLGLTRLGGKWGP
jgi:uncharacterized membrane protein YbhN (UPF0104 family)